MTPTRHFEIHEVLIHIGFDDDERLDRPRPARGSDLGRMQGHRPSRCRGWHYCRKRGARPVGQLAHSEA